MNSKRRRILSRSGRASHRISCPARASCCTKRPTTNALSRRDPNGAVRRGVRTLDSLISYGGRVLWTPAASTCSTTCSRRCALGVSVFCSSGDNGAELDYNGNLTSSHRHRVSSFTRACTAIASSGDSATESAWERAAAASAPLDVPPCRYVAAAAAKYAVRRTRCPTLRATTARILRLSKRRRTRHGERARSLRCGPRSPRASISNWARPWVLRSNPARDVDPIVASDRARK